jgi:nucleotide-binding universal stress UspA family protein
MTDANGAIAPTPMRVLVAVDGSPGSLVGVSLVNGLSWPTGTTIRFVSAIHEIQEIGYGLFGVPRPELNIEQPYLEDLQGALRTALESVPKGVTGESAVVHGRPADAILGDASQFEPDLIVAGSRGHGPIATMLLGSVSAELVDRAPCPVLVARGPGIGATLLAYDGSEEANEALVLLRRWPALSGQRTAVIGVAQPPLLWRSGIAPGMYRQVIDDYSDELAQLQAEYAELAADAAGQLKEAGIEAVAERRTGDPAQEILLAAEERGASLIVMGSRGRTGLKRVVLGSVARNVLINAKASVLVVNRRT